MKVEIKENNAKHAYEFLGLIDEAETEDEKIRLLKKWGANSPLNMVLSLNFNDNVVLDLPPGLPPYKRDETTHIDMMTPLAAQIHRLKSCTTKSPIKKMDKERVFIQVLELIAPQEADVLSAAKDKCLHTIYSTITKDLVKKVFPNYVS